MDKIQMGTFIREQRAVLGLTQQQLAEQLHVTNKAVSRWETGNAYPDIALLDDLAASLSVSVEELCRGEKLVRPSADTNTLLGDVISEVKQQKKDRAAKWLRILCLSIFTVILLAFLFFTGAFYIYTKRSKFRRSTLHPGFRCLCHRAYAFPVRNSEPSARHRFAAVTSQETPEAGRDHRLYPVVASVCALADLWRAFSLVAVILVFPLLRSIFASADSSIE